MDTKVNVSLPICMYKGFHVGGWLKVVCAIFFFRRVSVRIVFHFRAELKDFRPLYRLLAFRFDLMKRFLISRNGHSLCRTLLKSNRDPAISAGEPPLYDFTLYVASCREGREGRGWFLCAATRFSTAAPSRTYVLVLQLYRLQQ